MRLPFVLSEIGIGLRRNLTMTIAVIVTTAVSLGFVGFALLLTKQVDVMKDHWYDRVEISIFLCTDSSTASTCSGGKTTPAQVEQLRAEAAALEEVAEVFYEDSAAAYQAMRESFPDNPILDVIEPDQAPESLRIKLKNPEEYLAVQTQFQGRPGVDNVSDARTVLEPLFKALNGFQIFAITIAVVMLGTAALMIGNTVRLSAFSRRRETGIMRLVGASNWYIQLPFLLEGAIAGFIGASISSISLIALQKFVVEDRLADQFTFTNFIGWDAIWGTVPWLLLIGVGISSLASFLSLRKYLRV